MRDIVIAITAASYSGNKGAAAMLQSSIAQLKEHYGETLDVRLMSVYPSEDKKQCPHDFVSIVPAKPQQVLFFAFPCAVLYRVFAWCPPIRALLLKNKMLKTYAQTDMVLDEAGISFADSRGFVMNTYAFACAAIPLLMGVPVVKYAQALGPFENRYNRFLAKWILPKLTFIAARGRATYENLRSIGITDNVKQCADGAFTMPQALAVEENVQNACARIGFSGVVGLSISSVVARKCARAGIDYTQVMVDFIAWLTGRGWRVFMFANAARIHSEKPRNNDLMVGDAIAHAYAKKCGGAAAGTEGFCNGLCWEHREMDAEEIRAYIGHCRLLVASRFHAMVFALSKKVPVMLIGWSHKYQEVMEQFGLGAYAADFSGLTPKALQEQFLRLEENSADIRAQLEKNAARVQDSSLENIRAVTAALDGILAKGGGRARRMNHLIDLQRPDDYIGAHLACRMGYAADGTIRANAASGGVVTAFLCYLLRTHEIDGAWVVKTAFTDDGQLTYDTFIATSEQELRDASSSVYLSMPMLSHLAMLREFDGRLAVVLTPCMLRAFLSILEKEPALAEKIVLKIGLFCSGGHAAEATTFALAKARVKTDGAARLYYRRGHWRGTASVQYRDGTACDFSYKKTICAYKNAYFFIKKSCLSCKDQYAECADISFGDVWLADVKKDEVKYTGCVIRSVRAQQLFTAAAAHGELVLRHMTDTQMLRSQKRALTFKHRKSHWNHRLAGFLAVKNQAFSIKHPKLLKRVPMWLVYVYMCFIRVLLSF